MITHGWIYVGPYHKFGDLPHFPYIGGAQAVTGMLRRSEALQLAHLWMRIGYNSPNCGSCWQLTYKDNTINILAVDYAASGFNIAEEAMNALTDGQAVELGHVEVYYKEVSPSVCGL